MTRNRNSNFQRGMPTYTCDFCGKRTRETGGSESFVKLCRKCYELAGWENALDDGSITQEEFDQIAASL